MNEKTKLMQELLQHVNWRIDTLQKQGEIYRQEKNHIKHLSIIVATDELLRMKKLILNNFDEK
jgi:hypothetical protein